MNPEDYLLDALEIVEAWGLPDEEIIQAANQQARLMAGCCDCEDTETVQHH